MVMSAVFEQWNRRDAVYEGSNLELAGRLPGPN
jgi:hypothetical protein